jgi:hypothetical protein
MTIDPAFGLLLSIPIALAALAAAVIARPQRRAAALIAGCGILAFVAGCGAPKGNTDTAQTAAQPAASAAPAAPAAKPDASARMSAFTPAETTAARQTKSSGAVNVDVLDVRPDGVHQTELTVPSTDTVHVVGWAYDEQRKARCDEVGLLVDGKQLLPALYGYARPDVASFYKDPSRTKVGYSVQVRASVLGGGRHEATVVCVAAPASATRFGGSLHITVR